MALNFFQKCKSKKVSAVRKFVTLVSEQAHHRSYCKRAFNRRKLTTRSLVDLQEKEQTR